MKIRRVNIKGEIYNVEAYENPIPVGSVFPFAGITAPEGFLLCNGQEVSRITYAKLYEVIGDIYGAGDGSTTFNLPNIIEKVIEGTQDEVGQYREAGLPNIEGNVGAVQLSTNSGQSGALKFLKSKGYNWGTSDTPIWFTGTLKLNAKEYNNIYGNSDTVQPPAVMMPYIIKY